jgi:hypothetical protein
LECLIAVNHIVPVTLTYCLGKKRRDSIKSIKLRFTSIRSKKGEQPKKEQADISNKLAKPEKMATLEQKESRSPASAVPESESVSTDKHWLRLLLPFSCLLQPLL